MIELATGDLTEIAVVGAHCDDIAIGMGGTLLSLAGHYPDLDVHALVLSGGGSDREREEGTALSAFCDPMRLHLTVHSIPDGMAPAHWGRVKDAVRAFAATCSPQIVFGPHRNDAHQDHRLLAQMLPTEFRDHLVLGYEIPKWESDLPITTMYLPLSPEIIERKSTLLHDHYPSQTDRDWFDHDTFTGLTRIRGVQSHAQHAEAFVMDKAVLRLGAPTTSTAVERNRS